MEVVKNEVKPVPTPPPTYTVTLSEDEARTLYALVGAIGLGSEDKLIKGGQSIPEDFVYAFYIAMRDAGLEDGKLRVNYGTLNYNGY